MLSGKHILIIIENLPAPLDRRVWQEATTLKEFGAKVSIICPKMKGYNKSFESIDDIDIYRHALPIEGTGLSGYIQEYATALFWQMILSWRIFFKRKFHVIHACSPPDLMFLTALPFKIFGVKYVFDHHDLSPELYESKFKKKNIVYSALILLEKLTFMVSDYTIATNNSFKNIAINRGKKLSERVSVIRSGPDLNRMKIVEGNVNYKKGKKYLIGYIGIIAEQDGLDLLMHIIKKVLAKRADFHVAILGDGTELENVKRLAYELEISNVIDFYGMVTDSQIIIDILNTCDIGVNPDLPNEFNNLVTTNKVMEYMSLAKPVVQFDMREGKESAKEASLYAKPFDLDDFAEKICHLLDNDDKRKAMGDYGYKRVVNELSWEHESKKLRNFYSKILAEK